MHSKQGSLPYTCKRKVFSFIIGYMGKFYSFQHGGSLGVGRASALAFQYKNGFLQFILNQVSAGHI